MDLLIAIKDYIFKLEEYGFWPKKKPSLGKLEKLAELCYNGKIRKLIRYIPNTATTEQKNELNILIERINNIVNEEKNN